ncbi:MAG: serine/threonine-protein phosphatase [Bacteroidaceae bacterium]|nr:serine/threonine-protein phosphatase [Bacteroidaceae bacterium]
MKYKLKVISIQEIGKRPNQEDSIYPLLGVATDDDRVFVLCDGMGGHERGELASNAVCMTIGDYLHDKPFTENEFLNALNLAFEELDKIEVAANDKKKPGTTMTFLGFYDKGAFIAHIGDSRVYHIRPSKHQILFQTKDHSLVNQLLDLGEITPKEAKLSPIKNVISRAMLSNQNPRPKVDIYKTTDIKNGDYFLMCSDGMLEQITDDNIINIISLKDKSDENKAEILRKVTDNNNDNHSAHLIHVLKVIKRYRLPWNSY